MFLAGISYAGAGMSAIKITKASSVESVAKNDAGSSTTSAISSLVPTAINIWQGVSSLQNTKSQLTQECLPTTTEINFVDKMMKEWAKSGGAKPISIKVCDGTTYQTSVMYAADTSGLENTICADSFNTDKDEYKIWHKYPKAGIASYCKNGDVFCDGKDKVSVSNAYDLFALIPFAPEDYLASELTMAAQLQEKAAKCGTASINAKTKAAWSEFLMGTIGNLGQSTNTGAIVQQVSSMGGTGSGALNSLGGIATQFLMK